MRRALIVGAALLSALAIAGCGGDNSLFDLGTGGDAAAPLYKLHSGTYGVTAESSLVDGCMAFDATTAPFSSLTGITKVLANDGAGNISLGGPDANGTPTPAEPQEGASCPGSPANAACATATIQPPPQFDNNMGFLVSDYSLDDGQGCTIHRHVENVLTLTADDTFTAAYSVKDDQMTSGCTVETSACTTSFTWNWKKQ